MQCRSQGLETFSLVFAFPLELDETEGLTFERFSFHKATDPKSSGLTSSPSLYFKLMPYFKSFLWIGGIFFLSHPSLGKNAFSLEASLDSPSLEVQARRSLKNTSSDRVLLYSSLGKNAFSLEASLDSPSLEVQARRSLKNTSSDRVLLYSSLGKNAFSLEASLDSPSLEVQARRSLEEGREGESKRLLLKLFYQKLSLLKTYPLLKKHGIQANLTPLLWHGGLLLFALLSFVGVLWIWKPDFPKPLYQKLLGFWLLIVTAFIGFGFFGLKKTNQPHENPPCPISPPRRDGILF